MRTILLFVFLAIFCFPAISQTKISGTIKTQAGEPLPGANIFIKDSYDGISSDAEGNYSFVTEEEGDAVLVASFVGFKSKETAVSLTGTPVVVDIILESEAKEIRGVVVSAGSFEASDAKKGVVLRPIDIVTTAGANGDLYGALNTLPGTQQVGEQEGLFVRGGSSAETKTFIDDLLVQNPYFSSVPDIPSRGRFTPFLFKGTIFSTGGYSAQYGQALSSALILRSQDLSPDTRSAISLLAVGVGGAHTHRWENSSIVAAADYTNLAPYFAAVPQRTEWDKAPEQGSGQLVYRNKVSKSGMFKAYSTFSTSDLALFFPDLNNLGNKLRFALKNQNLFFSTGYSDIFFDDLTFSAGYSYSNNNDDILFEGNELNRDDNLHQVKVTMQKGITSNMFLTFGGEYHFLKFDNSLSTLRREFEENYAAAFVETDLFFTNDLAARIGLRFDNSNIIGKQAWSPRVALAYRLAEDNSINFAYGEFYQTPEVNFLNFTTDLNFENATHYILNYQYLSNRYTFRIEGYYKDYSSLVKQQNNFLTYNNEGSGYAKGIEVFWRDRATFTDTDYWVSYSYLDTKREYRNYPTLATPTFAAEHTLSIVMKYFIRSITTSLGFTYSFATGRPYYNPNNPVFHGDRTKPFQNLSFNASYLTTIFDKFTIVFFSITNIPGYENVYGYRYSNDGTVSQEVLPPSLRTAFLGLFISID